MRSALAARWKEEIEGWVFPSKRSRRGHIVSVEKQFLDARKEANIGKEVVLYCARHTFGTIAMEHTKNPAAVKDALGHEDLKTTLVYLHPDLSVIREVINRKNAMLESIAAIATVSTTAVPEVLSFGHKSGHSCFGVNSGPLAK